PPLASGLAGGGRAGLGRAGDAAAAVRRGRPGRAPRAGGDPPPQAGEKNQEPEVPAMEWSRNGVDHTRRYPDVAAAFAQLKPSTLVLDGELAVFDDQLRSRFEWLRDPDEPVVATPPVLIAFDVLYLKARDVSK